MLKAKHIIGFICIVCSFAACEHEPIEIREDLVVLDSILYTLGTSEQQVDSFSYPLSAVNTSTKGFNVDVDLNGRDDFRIVQKVTDYQGTFIYTKWIEPLHPRAKIGRHPNDLPDGHEHFLRDSLIDEHLNWRSAKINISNCGQTSYYNWSYFENYYTLYHYRFIPIMIEQDQTNYYGWLQMDYNVNVFWGGRLVDYAINLKGFRPIKAGQTENEVAYLNEFEKEQLGISP